MWGQAAVLVSSTRSLTVSEVHLVSPKTWLRGGALTGSRSPRAGKAGKGFLKTAVGRPFPACPRWPGLCGRTMRGRLEGWGQLAAPPQPQTHHPSASAPGRAQTWGPHCGRTHPLGAGAGRQEAGGDGTSELAAPGGYRPPKVATALHRPLSQGLRPCTRFGPKQSSQTLMPSCQPPPIDPPLGMGRRAESEIRDSWLTLLPVGPRPGGRREDMPAPTSQVLCTARWAPCL